MNTMSMFERGTEQSMIAQTEADLLQSDHSNNATCRYFYEDVESRQQPAIDNDPTSSQSQSSATDAISTLPNYNVRHEHTWDHNVFSDSAELDDKSTQRNWWRLPWRLPARIGYWDLMSVFRSKGSHDGDEEKVLQ